MSITCALTLFLLTWSSLPALATLEYDLGEALFLSWYFENADPAWEMGSECYFHDYNGDGLADYLIRQTNGTDKDRIFCLDTSNSPDPKVYPGDRTAWREVPWEPGTFIPSRLYIQKELTVLRTPDLILMGRDDTQSDYTRFIFRKLDETNPAFPTEDEWSIDVNAQYDPTLYWPASDLNGDDYPDFFVYNSTADDSGHFIIRCFSGMDGTPLWETNLSKAVDDTLLGFGSSISVDVFSTDPNSNTSSDFDGDGKPEIFVWYAYKFLQVDPPVPGSKGKLTLLKSGNGQHISLYPDWWDVYDYSDMTSFSWGAVTMDFNKDTFADLEVMTMNPSEGIPILRVIDLKTKTDLFQTENTDFGSTPEEWGGFFPQPVFSTGPDNLGDVDGDGWRDLVFIHAGGFGGSDVRYAVCRGYTDTVDKGRRMWSAIADGTPPYDFGQSAASDWNGDGLMDLALVMNPVAPANSKIEWGYALQTIGPNAPTLYKTFNNSFPYTDPWNPDNDEFLTPFSWMGPMGDIDGDSRQDSFVLQQASVDHGKDNTVDLSFSRVLFIDNTPAGSPPDITADFLGTLRNEGTTLLFSPLTARDVGHNKPVDQNGDGAENDILILSSRAVFALSFAPGTPVKVTQGDVNGDEQVTLADAILSFQIATGEQPSEPVNRSGDVNGDMRIGTEEGVYGMQMISGVRVPPQTE